MDWTRDLPTRSLWDLALRQAFAPRIVLIVAHNYLICAVYALEITNLRPECAFLLSLVGGTENA